MPYAPGDTSNISGNALQNNNSFFNQGTTPVSYQHPNVPGPWASGYIFPTLPSTNQNINPVVGNNKSANKKLQEMNSVVNNVTSNGAYRRLQAGQYNSDLSSFSNEMRGYGNNLETAYNKFNDLTTQINNGTLPVSPEEQTMLDTLKGVYERSAQLQERANKSSEGAAREFANTLGINVTSPLQAQGYLDNAITEGINKITDINAAGTLKIFETKQALQDKKYTKAKTAYDEYAQLVKDRSNTVKDIYDRSYQKEKDLRDYNLALEKFNLDAEKQPYEIAKLKAESLSNRINAQNTTLFSDKQIRQIDGSAETKKLLALKDLQNKLTAYRLIAAQPGKYDVVGARKTIADSLYADLKIAYKEAANLGALTGPDVGLIQEAIKPTSGGIGAKLIGYKLGGGQKGVLASIDTALSTLKKSRDTYGKTLSVKWGSTDPYIQNLITDDPETAGSSIPAEQRLTQIYTQDAEIASLIDQITDENPDYSADEVLQIIGE